MPKKQQSKPAKIEVGIVGAVPKDRKKESFEKKVQRVINKQIERKQYVIAVANNAITTTSGGGTPTALNLMPALALGTNQEARVGERVKITKATVKGYVNLLPYNATSNPLSTPVMVKMWVASSKLTNVTTLGSTAIGTGFFEVGSDTVGFQGNMLDMILPVNKEAWTVYGHKQFELGATYASAAGAVGTGGYYDNSKMTIPFKFNYGKHFKRQLRYSDDSSSLNSNYPYDRNCWLLIQVLYADGSSSGGYIPAEYHYSVNVEYTDL